jgi:hypothetical protein
VRNNICRAALIACALMLYVFSASCAATVESEGTDAVVIGPSPDTTVTACDDGSDPCLVPNPDQPCDSVPAPNGTSCGETCTCIRGHHTLCRPNDTHAYDGPDGKTAVCVCGPHGRCI